MIAVCADPSCEASATWAIHPLPYDDVVDPLPILVCDAHAAILEPLEDPHRPRGGIA